MNDQARTQGGCPGTVAAASIAPSTITPIVNGLSTARRAMTPAQTIAPNPLSKCLDFWGTVHTLCAAGLSRAGPSPGAGRHDIRCLLTMTVGAALDEWRHRWRISRK